MRVSVFRKAHFNAAHRIYRPDWSDKKNEEFFGKCSNPHYHGHNYELEVKVSGEVNPDTGYLIDLKDLKTIIKEEVEDRMDHKNLNEEVSEFKNLIPTAEHITYVIHRLIRTRLDDNMELKIRLYETPRNFVEYPA
ncbi:MAG: 6-carboxytetrahydropterin synthase [Bacteroidetes bacterium]|jgi:6-pyruvoyltetrahydropterin/6-carboxytetrahydropterin synthase|nr:6-carboxytetrahydropterin synthase [Bacteroidota bacterium]